MITEDFKDIIRACEQCGTCTASCPTKEASDFNIRKVIRHLQLELHEDEEFLTFLVQYMNDGAALHCAVYF